MDPTARIPQTRFQAQQQPDTVLKRSSRCSPRGSPRAGKEQVPACCVSAHQGREKKGQLLTSALKPAGPGGHIQLSPRGHAGRGLPRLQGVTADVHGSPQAQPRLRGGCTRAPETRRRAHWEGELFVCHPRAAPSSPSRPWSLERPACTCCLLRLPPPGTAATPALSCQLRPRLLGTTRHSLKSPLSTCGRAPLSVGQLPPYAPFVCFPRERRALPLFTAVSSAPRTEPDPGSALTCAE